MSKQFCLVAFFLFFSFCETISAQTSKGGSLKDVSFIEGHWKATLDNRTIEGVWLPPDGDNMVGMMRMMKESKADLYEILVYELKEQGLVSLVKHFKPGLLGVEDKDKQDVYLFLEAGKGWAEFEKQGDPLRIRYEKRSADQFVIRRGNLKNGKWEFADLFVFNRIK